MSRSKWKGPFINSVLFIKSKSGFNKFNCCCRSSVITQKLLNKVVHVYDGKLFVKLLITEDMVGYKLGEFILTRKSFSYKKK